MKLPEIYRPKNVRYKHCIPGLDFSSSFLDNLKAIDRDFHLVWHPYRTIWDPIINESFGSIDDPRFVVQNFDNQLVFGFVERNPKDWSPMPDNSWHIWRLAYPNGWAHILKIESKHPEYLKLILDKLYTQKVHTDRYGLSSYSKIVAQYMKMEQERELTKNNDL